MVAGVPGSKSSNCWLIGFFCVSLVLCGMYCSVCDGLALCVMGFAGRPASTLERPSTRKGHKKKWDHLQLPFAFASLRSYLRAILCEAKHLKI